MHWGRVAIVEIGMRMVLADGLDVRRRLIRVRRQAGAELESVQVAKVETRVGIVDAVDVDDSVIVCVVVVDKIRLD
jgi:hypothetical protein